MDHYGVVDAGSTLYVFFTTHDTDGAPIAPSSAFEAADVRIYKNGSSTQRSSEAGYTMTSPFDSVTGLHLIAIDLSDNTDAGFYAAGSRYSVVLSPDETVDGLAVVRVLADFTIGPVAADVEQWLGQAVAAVTTNGVPEVDVTHWGGTAVGSTTVRANVITVEGTDATDYFATLDDAILAVIGALDNAAADGDPTDTDTLVAYVKQLINVLVGSAGVVAYPAAAAPGNGVSLAEVLRSVYDDTNETQGKLPTNKFMGSSTAADKDDEIDAIKAKTDNLPSDPADQSALEALINAVDDFVDTEVAAIKAKTDNLPSDPADQSALEALINAVDDFVDTEVASIKATVEAVEVDTQDIQSRLPAALTGGGNIKADVLAVSGDATAADRLEALMDGLIIGQVNDAAATTTGFVADGFTEATNDHFNGRLITFLTGALTGQQTAITDYVGATQTFTVDALTEAPADDDFFVIH